MINSVALSIFIVLFLLVTVLGFVAARWRRADLAHLNEWGLGGRSFGTVITWFLLGGDLYTAYTFVAVPALVFGTGAAGMFALPYTIIVYPLVFLVMPRLWSVAHRHQYVTPADFVRGRFSSPTLALAIALTGLIATMPYIALQLVGIQVVLEGMGISGSGLARDLPLIIAFLILAAYTYSSGLRAPALIAFVKDILIYATVIVAVIYIPAKLGGWGHIFDAAAKVLPTRDKPAGLILQPKQYLAYSTLALGSAMALFLYPHSITGVLSSRDRNVVRRNAAVLPAYSFLLGLIALLGYMAIAAGIRTDEPNMAVPLLFNQTFPSWFRGVAFAAIAIGALVPAAIMSIAAANLFTRNIYREYLRRDAGPREESRVARLVSLVVKVGALAFILLLKPEYALNLQLLGGIWILQTLPSVVLALYTRWFHRWALLAGWLAGMATGSLIASKTGFEMSTVELQVLGVRFTAYAAVTALVVNLVVATVLTPVLNALKAPAGRDETAKPGYEVEAAPPIDELAEPEPAGGHGSR
jgi:solute:Na+ symporter, SSS family